MYFSDLNHIDDNPMMSCEGIEREGREHKKGNKDGRSQHLFLIRKFLKTI